MKKKIALLTPIILLSIFVFFNFDTISNHDIFKKSKTSHSNKNYNNVGIVYVLSGGGAKALAHVGALEELEKIGLKPSLIIGVSSGAIVGSMYASGMPPSKIKSILMKSSAADFIDYSITQLPTSLSSNTNLHKFLDDHLTIKKFNRLKIPFIAVATNLDTGDQTAISDGEIIPAVLASSSYPGVYEPVKINGVTYIDGGVSGNLPILLAHKYNNGKILGINIGYGIDEGVPTNMIDILLKSVQIMQKNHDDLIKQKSDITIDIDLHEVSGFDESNNELSYQKGREAILKSSKDLIKKFS